MIVSLIHRTSNIYSISLLNEVTRLSEYRDIFRIFLAEILCFFLTRKMVKIFGGLVPGLRPSPRVTRAESESEIESLRAGTRVRVRVFKIGTRDLSRDRDRSRVLQHCKRLH